MATVKNDAAKKQIIKKLNEGGYPTYARLLNLFDIYLTDNPEVVGYMVPNAAKIVLNGDLDIDQISTIVRHEMLHEWLTHSQRYDVFKKANKNLNPELDPEDLRNIAADYEISNVGYTEADKSIARRIKLGDRVLQGLVTEDKYPGWTRMSFEDMLKELLERSKEDREQLQKLIDMLNQLNQQDLDDMQDQMENNESEGENQPSQKQQSGKDNKKDDQDSDQQSGSNKEDSKDIGDKLSKEIDKVKDKLDKIDQDKDTNPIDSKEDQEAKKELVRRVEEIKKAFSDAKQMEAAKQQARIAKQAEKQSKIKKAEDRMSTDPLRKFKLNLNSFIANEIEEINDETYSRINPSYEDSEFIVPGKLYRENKNIPVINVYHDTSGSFTSHPEKQKMVDRVIATLQKYEDQGDIKINRYYHADRVAPTREQAGMGNNGNAVMEHILETKPDNVIITTDSDLDGTSIPVQIPGAVWMLFFDSRSDGLIENLRGKKQTKIYDIDY